jgi:hypothetical protein
LSIHEPDFPFYRDVPILPFFERKVKQSSRNNNMTSQRSTLFAENGFVITRIMVCFEREEA